MGTGDTAAKGRDQVLPSRAFQHKEGKAEDDPDLNRSQREAGVLPTLRPSAVQSQKTLFFSGVLPQSDMKCQRARTAYLCSIPFPCFF